MTDMPASAWYPVALTSDIDPGTSNGTRLFDREIVVWRDSASVGHVWEDRCPHRGMRLSFGFVRNDRIACLYHGWQYDAGGQCRLIPAHPHLSPPDTIRVPPLNSVERLGMIWAHSGPESTGDPPLEERPVRPVRSIAIDCPPATAASRLGYHSGPASDDGTSGDWTVAAPAPSLVVLGSGDHAILLGIQPLSARECTLHAVIAGPGGDRLRVSHWLEEFRRTVEAEGVA